MSPFKCSSKNQKGWCTSDVTLEEKTVIITGGNAGIGYETALNLAKRGARIIIACRSKQRGEDAQKQINIATGRDNVFVKILDFSSLESVRKFANHINETEERLDILINNAGVSILEDKRTVDGFPATMQINYFGPFLLTNLLLDLLKKTPSSRIVNVSSIVAKFTSIDVNKLTEFPGRSIYANTKLCNILFTIELAKRLEGTSVTTNSLHPGIIKTGILQNLPAWLKVCTQIVSQLFYISVEAGAQTTIYCAVAEELEHVSGAHFDQCKQVRHYKSARDPELAKKLWTETEKLINLNSSHC